MGAEIRAIVLAHARSGSTLLMDFLGGQPDTAVAYEMFHQKTVNLPAYMGIARRDAGALKPERDADPLGFLERVAAACPTRIFGFKWFRGHAPVVRDRLVADPAWRVVILHRENFLALFASQRTARLTGRYVARTAGAEAPSAPLLPFDADEFLRDHARYRGYYDGLLRECDAAGKSFHLVEYRHLSHPAVLRNVARHVGVQAPILPEPRLVKQGSARLLGRFEDPGLVQRTLDRLGRPQWAIEEEGFLRDPGAAEPGQR
jgi:LPS sulfotransferase NodH